jgi:hypothetical protein
MTTGEEDVYTLRAANNLADVLLSLKRFEEARSLMRKATPVARRVFGQSHDVTFTMKKIHAEALYHDPGATHDDLREAVTILEELERAARRVLGSSHPRVRAIERSLARSRAALRAREDA